jgi:hypothetical protein
VKLSVLAGVTIVVVGSVVAVPAVGAKEIRPTVSPLQSSSATLESSGGTVTLSASVTNATICTFTSNRAVIGLTSAPCTTGIVTDKVTLPPNTTDEPNRYTLKLKVVGTESSQVRVTVFAPPPSGLAWTSPPSVTVGTPFTESSIDKCPTTMPDGSAITGTLYALVWINSVPSGGAGNAVVAKPDGSWSITWSINGSFPAASFTTTAECYVVPSGPVLGTYASHSVAVLAPAKLGGP